MWAFFESFVLLACAAATSAVPPRQLPLHDYTTQAISGHQSPIVCLASHPTQPLVFTADQGGLNMLWCTGPLTPLGGLAAVLGGSIDDGKTSLVSSACWLKGQAQCSSTEVAGILAVGVGPRVSVIGVTARWANVQAYTCTEPFLSKSARQGAYQCCLNEKLQFPGRCFPHKVLTVWRESELSHFQQAMLTPKLYVHMLCNILQRLQQFPSWSCYSCEWMMLCMRCTQCPLSCDRIVPSHSG